MPAEGPSQLPTSRVDGTDRRVLVVDDQHALADAIRLSIDLADGLVCIGVAGDIATALQLCRDEPVDVVLMDIGLPDVDGIEGTRRIKADFPEVDVYIFTGFGDLASLTAVAASGASGFFTKNVALHDVLEALRSPVDRQLIVDPRALAAILTDTVSRLEADAPGEHPTPDSRPPLTERETQVLRLLGDGMGPQAIALDLGLSVHTVRGHVKSILAKLNVHSQLEAVSLAVANGWLDLRRGDDQRGETGP